MHMTGHAEDGDLTESVAGLGGGVKQSKVGFPHRPCQTNAPHTIKLRLLVGTACQAIMV